MSNSTSESKRLTVGFPLYGDVTLLDFAGATQVFAFAGGFDAIWLAADKSPVKTSEGVEVLPQYAFGDDYPPIDILFVPGGGGKGVAAAMLDEPMQQFVKGAALSAQWHGSVCVGAFILAAAGLLDDSAATTYWSALNILQRFPKIHVDTNSYPRYLVDPDTHCFSGGGVSSSIDLALELVLLIKGKEAAEAAQLAVQYAPGPPVNSGDPSTASSCLVKKMREHQAKQFLVPIAEATGKVLAGWNTQTLHL